MWGLLATLLFLHIGRLVCAKCAPSQTNNGTTISGPKMAELLRSPQHCLNFSGRVIHLPGNASVGGHVKELDLSGTMLHSLPPELLARARGLESLSLRDNNLKELPPRIFEETPRLKSLGLAKNPLLSAVPVGSLRHCLETLTVDCSCNTAGSIRAYCQNCTQETECRCVSARDLLNATDFFAQRCHGPSPGLYATAVVPVVALILIAGLVYFLVRKKQGASFAQDKRASTGSDGARGQPRYIRHAGPQGDVAREAAGGHTDYANVFMDQPQRAIAEHSGKSSWPPGTPLGEQPIYANTQDLYYNYRGPIGAASEAQNEELYVIPDK